MIIADTSGLLALYNRSEPAHAGVADAVAATLTLDHRHFGMLRPLDRGRFTILPNCPAPASP